MQSHREAFVLTARRRTEDGSVLIINTSIPPASAKEVHHRRRRGASSPGNGSSNDGGAPSSLVMLKDSYTRNRSHRQQGCHREGWVLSPLPDGTCDATYVSLRYFEKGSHYLAALGTTLTGY
jgi:hypothetical protein